MSRIMKKVDKADLFFGIMMVGVVALHMSRIQLGMAEMDESFYLTVPYRLIQGDALLVDEWHPSQLQAVLLFPILKIYLNIVGNTEGIYLAFRYIWLVCSVLTSVISYILLRKNNKYIAAVSCTMISLFTYACLRALSYNTMGVMSVWLLVVFSVTETRFVRIRNVISGVLMAFVILCNPYMILLYFIFAFACIVKREKDGYYGLKTLGDVTVGGAVIAVLVLILIFSRATLSEVMQNLRGILNDPAHQQKTIIDFLRPIVEFVVWFKLYFIFFAIGTVVLVCIHKLKKLAFAGLVSLSCVMWILLIVFKTEGVGRFAIYLPLTMLGVVAFALTKKKNWIFFNRGWITGIVYAICMNLSSNQGIYVICNACIISSGISLFLIKDYLDENEMWFGRRFWLILLAVMQIFSQVWINWNYVFWADDISKLTFKIETGPMKGIYVTEEQKANYETDCENIKALGNLSGKYIMFFNHFPAGYLLVPEARCGAFSAWISEYASPDNERFINYYKLHPDRVPDVVYFDVNSNCHWTMEEWNNWRNMNGF